MGDFKRLYLIDLPFGNKKIEKFVNKEKKYVKKIKVYSLAMKFGGSFLDFRDEMAGCVVVLMSAIEKRHKRQNKKVKRSEV
jgi:hypothetical protein